MAMYKDRYPSAAAELRRHANKRFSAKAVELDRSRTEEDMQRLFNELEVHQLELEMQNAELRQARDEVETSLVKYTDLYDFAPVGYFTLDRDEIIVEVNLTGASLLGIERTKLLGRRFGALVAVEARHAFSGFLEDVLNGPTKETCEIGLLKEGNGPLFVQLQALSAASGEECRIAVLDISERRQLEGKLEIMYTELADHATQLATANIELEAFNYTVSHDLRSPLTNINGYCQVLQLLCSDQLDEQSKEYIRGIYKGTLHMNQLIASLLNFSRVTSIDISRETVDLSSIAHAVAADHKLAGLERNVTFRIAEGIWVNGDAGLLRVVLDNLIGNAWKYCVSKEETVIEFGVTEVAGEPAFFVRDNGQGFDMTFAEKLFVPFQRLSGRDIEGHGIGLATVDRIVKRHGGRVWAESAPGKGATFLFTLLADQTSLAAV